jgi:hypothetical protein
MGFRRNSEAAREWKQWLLRHRDELVSCGLPDSVLQEKHSWWRFLEHGYDEPTGWKPEMLSSSQVRRLYDFVLREHGREPCRVMLLYDLERLLGIQPTRDEAGTEPNIGS